MVPGLKQADVPDPKDIFAEVKALRDRPQVFAVVWGMTGSCGFREPEQ